MSTKDEPVRQIRPFTAVVQELAGGRVLTGLSEALADVTAAVAETGKKGTVTLQLTVAPVGKGASGALQVTAKTAVKAPESDDATPTTVFFADDDGNLTRTDPKQLQLPLREVTTRKDTA